MEAFTSSPDLVLATLIGAAGVYGLVGGSARLRSLVLATYVGIVLAEVHTNTLLPFLGSLGKDGIALLLLAIPVVVFMVPRHKGHGEKGHPLVNGVVGLAAGAFLVAAGLHVILPSTEAVLAPNSSLATALLPVYTWLVLGMPVVALLPHFWKKSGKSDKH
jgi:hypothetical protein